MKNVEQEFLRLYIRGYSASQMVRALSVDLRTIRELERTLVTQRIRLRRSRSPDFIEPIIY